MIDEPMFERMQHPVKLRFYTLRVRPRLSAEADLGNRLMPTRMEIVAAYLGLRTVRGLRAAGVARPQIAERYEPGDFTSDITIQVEYADLSDNETFEDGTRVEIRRGQPFVMTQRYSKLQAFQAVPHGES